MFNEVRLIILFEKAYYQGRLLQLYRYLTFVHKLEKESYEKNLNQLTKLIFKSYCKLALRWININKIISMIIIFPPEKETWRRNINFGANTRLTSYLHYTIHIRSQKS